MEYINVLNYANNYANKSTNNLTNQFVKRYSHSIFMNWVDETLIQLKSTPSRKFVFNVPDLKELIQSSHFNQSNHNNLFQLSKEIAILNDLNTRKIQLTHQHMSLDEWSYERYKIINVLNMSEDSMDRQLICLILTPFHNKTYTNLTFVVIDVTKHADLLKGIHLYLNSVLYVCTNRSNVSLIMFENDIYIGYTKYSTSYDHNKTEYIQILKDIETEINTIRFQFNSTNIDDEMFMYGFLLSYVLNITYIGWVYVHLSILKWIKTNRMVDFDEYKDYDFSYEDGMKIFSYDTYVKLCRLSHDIHSNKELENELHPIFERLYNTHDNNDNDNESKYMRFPYLFGDLKERVSGKTEQKINKTIKINMSNKNMMNDFMFEQFELTRKEIHIHIQEILHSPRSFNVLIRDKDKLLKLSSIRIIKRMLSKTDLLLNDDIKPKPPHIGHIVHSFIDETRYVIKYIKAFIDKRQHLTHIVTQFKQFQKGDEIEKKTKDEIIQYYIFYYVMIKYTFEYSWKYKENGLSIRYILESNNDFWKLLNSYKYLRINQIQYAEIDNYCKICDIVDKYDLDNYMNSTYLLLDKIKSYISIDVDLSNLIPTVYPYRIEWNGMYDKMIYIYSMIDEISKHENKIMNVEYYKQINGMMLNVNKELKKYKLINEEVVAYDCQLFVSQYIKLEKLLKVMYDRELIRDLTQIMDNIISDEEHNFHYFMKNYYQIAVLKGIFDRMLVDNIHTLE